MSRRTVPPILKYRCGAMGASALKPMRCSRSQPASWANILFRARAHAQDPVALADAVQHVLARDHLSEEGVLAVQVRLLGDADEELAVIGIHVIVAGHADRAAQVMQLGEFG